MTAEEKIARVKDFRLIDDVFFEVFAEDKEACQEILQVILEEDGLTVLDVVVQSSKRNTRMLENVLKGFWTFT